MKTTYRLVRLLSLACVLVLGLAWAARAADEADLTELVRETLRQHPELVLDVIKENPSVLLQALEPRKVDLVMLVESGVQEFQRVQREQGWQAQLADPLKPEIDESRPMKGVKDAPITVVEYSDFQCPYCSRAAATLDELLEKYQGKLRVFFKNMPLKGHKLADEAAAYYEAAARQDHDKAWKLYNTFFTHQKELGDGGVDWMKAQAKELGLDMERLEADAASEEVKASIAKDTAEAESFGARGTPFFVVGGVAVPGALKMDEFEKLLGMIDNFRAGKAPGDQPAPEGEQCQDCLDKAGAAQ